jgi:HSP90 family molecular chaperone
LFRIITKPSKVVEKKEVNKINITVEFNKENTLLNKEYLHFYNTINSLKNKHQIYLHFNTLHNKDKNILYIAYFSELLPFEVFSSGLILFIKEVEELILKRAKINI